MLDGQDESNVLGGVLLSLSGGKVLYYVYLEWYLRNANKADHNIAWVNIY